MTSPTGDDVWSARDFPVLTTAARLAEVRPGQSVDSRSLAREAGMDHDDVVRALVNLDQRYLDVALNRVASGMVVLASVRSITAAGLEATGRWPSPATAADRFLEALDAAIDSAPVGSPKASRLERARESAVAMGRDVLVEVMGGVLTGRIPLG